MDECPECLGLWLDVAAVERLVQERQAASTQAVLAMDSSTGEGAIAPNPPGRMYIKCPECAAMMSRSNFAKRSGVIIDTCRGHGTWFDADELTRIVEFVAAGGVERSAEASKKRQQQELRQARAESRAQAAKSSLMEDIGSQRAGFLGAFGGAVSSVGSW